MLTYCSFFVFAAATQFAAAVLCSAEVAVAATSTGLQPYAACDSTGCSHSPSSTSSSSQPAGRQHTGCKSAQRHLPACPVGFSCQQQRSQGWLCLPDNQGATAAPAADATQQAAASTYDIERRSLAEIVPDNPAVATRTTNSTAAGSPPPAGSTAAGAANNSALAPRATGDAAPAANSTAGSNLTANAAVTPRASNETAAGASNSSSTQAAANTRQAVPLANCPAGQTAIGSQCVKSGTVGTASSGVLDAMSPGHVLRWLVISMCLAVLMMSA